jgi:hypothetical protein
MYYSDMKPNETTSHVGKSNGGKTKFACRLYESIMFQVHVLECVHYTSLRLVSLILYAEQQIHLISQVPRLLHIDTAV